MPPLIDSVKKMKFVALLSGGKDSCLAAIKCAEYGHELVCLANLYPPSEGPSEELNSFMYQSAGHSAIVELAKCFEKPLIRRQIRGKSLHQSLDYNAAQSSDEYDEVEDLYMLLTEVKQRFPDVAGVSCGAIVSTFQRLRLESVCRRNDIGMTPLCYLWNYDRVSLLNEIVNNESLNMEVILVKVAGAGLLPEKHLGKTLRTLHPQLISLHKKYGLDVCGEGGEYESFVLNCSLFRRFRLAIENSEIVLDEEDPSCGHLRIISCKAVPKSNSKNASWSCEADDDDHVVFEAEALVVPASSVDSVPYCDVDITYEGAEEEQKQAIADLRRSCVGLDGLGFSPLLCVMSHELLSASSSNESAEQCARMQVASLLIRLRHILISLSGQLADVFFVRMYISDMMLFQAVNAEYCKFFGKNPPSLWLDEAMDNDSGCGHGDGGRDD